MLSVVIVKFKESQTLICSAEEWRSIGGTLLAFCQTYAVKVSDVESVKHTSLPIREIPVNEWLG